MKQLYLLFLLVCNCSIIFGSDTFLPPSASISGTTTVCQNAASPVITFTGSGGVAPYTFIYQINSGANLTTAQSTGNIITITAPTGTVGPFIYTLVSVTDSTNATQNQTGTATVAVNGLPTVPIITNNGNTTFCQGGNVILSTSNITGLTYQWNLNGIPISNATSINHTAISSGNYTITVTNSNGCTSTSSLIAVIVHPIIDPVLGANGSTSAVTFQNTLYFTRCITSPTGVINIVNQTLNQSQVTSYTLNWGDTSPILNLTSFTTNQTHTYNQGFYTLTISLTTTQGCVYNKSYGIFVGNTPSGSLGNPGNLSGCSPKTIDFPIIAPASNVPGTQYIIDFGDGQSVTYIHPNAPASVLHTYNNSSCGNIPTGTGSLPNSFVASMTITNPCFPPAFTTVGPIIINTPPTPNFTITPNPGCVNTSINILNTSNPGTTIGSGGCISSPSLYWVISPTTGWNATGLGSNGGNANDIDSWNNGINAPSINFNTIGNYSITLFIGNSCDIKSVTKTICIEQPLMPQFTLNTNSGCIPLAVTTNNTTSYVNQCTTPTYIWSVSYAPANCGVASAYTYTGGTSAASASPSFNFTEAGIYTITLTATNSCVPPQSITQIVTVKKSPTVTIDAISDFCGNANINPTASIPACALPGILTYAWTFPAGIPATSSSATPGPINYPVGGPYTISLVVSNLCGNTPMAFSNTFTVLSAPIIQNETVTVCSGVSFSVTPTTATTGNTIPVGTSYSWPTPIVSGGITGGAAGTNQTSISGTLLNPTSSPQTATYVITPTVGSCSGSTFTVVVTVNPAAQVNQPTPVSVCNGVTTPGINFTTTNPSGTSFSWTNSTPSIGLAASGNGNIPAFIAVNTSAAPIIATIIVTPSFSGGSAICSGVSKTFTITINPTGQINQPTNLLQCNGDIVSLPFSTSNTGGTTIYSWTNDTPTIGLPATGTGNISFTASNSTSNPLVATIVVAPSYNNGSSNCVGPSKTFTITINPSAQVNQHASISVCNGNTIPTTTFSTTNTSGTTSYTWTNSNTAIGLSATGTGNISSFTAINTGNSVLTATIIVTPSYLIGATFCTGTTKQFTISISPDASVNTITDKIVCNGSNSPSIPFTSPNTGGTTSYSWTNDNPSIGLAAFGTGNIPLFTAVNTGLVPITATLSVIPSFTNGSLVCTGIPQTFTITVNPSASSNSINNIEVCNGSSIPSIVFSTNNSGGSTTYSWTNSNTSIGLAANGNGNIPTFMANNTGSIPLIATITVTPIYTNAGVNCNGISQSFTIKINPSPTGTISGTASVCLNATAPQITFTGSAGNPPYTYTYTLNNGANQTISTTSGNSVSISVPTNILGTFTYNLVNVQDSNATSCLNSISQSAIVTVNAAPLIDISPTPTQTICVGGTIQNPLSVSFINGTGTPTYQWYSNSNNTTTGGIPVGTNLPNYTPPIFSAPGTFYYYAVITLSGNGCGPIVSDVAEIIIIADPIINTQPLPSQTLCQNVTPTSLDVTVSGGIGTTYFYQWYSNTVNSTTSGTLITGETNATFIPPTTNAGTTYYYCIVTQTNGSGCNVTSTTAAVIVNLAPAITTQPVSSTICIGQTPTLLSVSYINGVGTPQYQWYSNTTNSTVGSTLINSATNASYAPQNTIAGTTYYYCVITFSTGGCSSITSTIASVIINENPIIAAENSVICSGTSFSVTPTNTGGNVVPIGTTYTWTNPTISPLGSITGASAETTPQSSISQTLLNTTTNPATATYTVTPTSGSCIGNSFTIIVTVNPAINPNVTVVNNTCFGINNATISTNITGGIPPYSIAWTGPGGYTSVATSISNLQPGNYTLTVGDVGNCPFTASYTITEPALIIITAINENDITCFGANNGAINISVSGGTGAYTYTWTNNGLPFASSEDLTNLGPGTYTVTVTDVNNCPSNALSFTITEPPVLGVSLVNQTNVLCFGAATGAISINVIGGKPIQTSPGVFNYTYSWTGPNGFTSSNQNLTNLVAGTYQLTVTDANGCIQNLVVTVTQTPEITIAFTTTPITCFGANNASISVTLSGGNAPYQFQWNNLATTLNQTNLSAGNYTITVTDNLNCIKSVTIPIPQAPVFMVNPIVSQITCNGANNGSINLNLTGGITPVSLVWGDGSPAGLIRNNLGQGTYSYTILDGTPCTLSGSITLIEPQPLVLAANITNALNCTNANSGAINLLVSGGTPPFNYVWSNGTTVEDLVNVPAGNYLVTVTDSRGCIQTGQYSITTPAPIVLNVTTSTNSDCANFTITQNFSAQVTGGIPPYQFNWSSGTVSGVNNELMSTSQSGLILLTAVDAIGCSATYSFNVVIPVLIDAGFNSNSIGYTTYGEYSILDPIQFTNTATGDFTSIAWNFGDGTFSTEDNPIHIYTNEGSYVVTQTVTYPFGCVYTHVITLVVKKGYILVVPSAFTPNNDNLNDTFRPVTKALTEVHLDIYDTWGSLIYTEIGDVLVGWDAKIKGVTAENGNYNCRVSGKTFYGTIVNDDKTFVLIK